MPDTLLTLNRIDENILSALELIVESGAWDAPGEDELDVLFSGPDFKGSGTAKEDLARSTNALGRSPDLVVSERDGMSTVLFLGKDPRDVLLKARSTMS